MRDKRETGRTWAGPERVEHVERDEERLRELERVDEPVVEFPQA